MKEIESQLRTSNLDLKTSALWRDGVNTKYRITLQLPAGEWCMMTAISDEILDDSEDADLDILGFLQSEITAQRERALSTKRPIAGWIEGHDA